MVSPTLTSFPLSKDVSLVGRDTLEEKGNFNGNGKEFVGNKILDKVEGLNSHTRQW
jgi:hypothetical protein